MAGENSTSVVSESKFKNLDDILVELNKRNSLDLRKEYEQIGKQSVQGTYEAAQLPENLWKNRYVNDSFFALDQSRVKLLRVDNGSD
jgi:predicted N-acyltransferase